MSDRSTHTDALATLGTIIGPAEKRDAIHLAVEPAVAGHTLRPGQDVGIADGVAGASTKHVGIVDPFLKDAVKKGERFWLVVYPRQITSLRHVWTHPEIPEAGPASTVNEAPSPQPETSKAWLEAYSLGLGEGYQGLLDLATRYLDSGGYWDPDEGLRPELSLPDVFWNHYEAVTGRAVPAESRGDFFKCSC